MKIQILFLPIIFFFIASCCKEGTGGEATIAAFPKHHGKAIKGATVFIKYNANELPGTTPEAFDAVLVGDSKEDHIHIENLKCGEYYLYSTGYDSSISMAVQGGIPVKIKFGERKEELDIEIPVSE